VTGDFVAATTPTVTAVGNDVVLNFTPVPEPVSVLWLLAAGLGYTVRRRRRGTTRKCNEQELCGIMLASMNDVTDQTR
jgi:hypothetical protein